MKIIALDIGTVRIGIATSDIMEIIASAYEVYRRKHLAADVKYVAELVSKLDAGEVVIGLPLKLDGSEGQSVEMAKSFGEELSKLITVPIVIHTFKKFNWLQNCIERTSICNTCNFNKVNFFSVC